MDKQKQIEQFKNAVEELVQTKYILIGKKLVELLTVIDKNRDVYNYIAECGINFNFDRVMKACKVDGKFVLPEKDHVFVAFVYALLKKFECEELNMTDFLKENFENGFSNIDGFQFFGISVLKRFEVAVENNVLGIKPKKLQTKAPIKQVDENIVKRVSFLIESVLNQNLKNKTFDDDVIKHFFEVLNELLKKGNFAEVCTLFEMIKKVEFKDKIVKSLIKEILEVVKADDGRR